MNIHSAIHQGRVHRQSGLTLVEMLVASTLLLLILMGLMLMFNQTQKAFRTGLRQNDVMETGRAAMDIIARDVEQMAAAYRVDVTNTHVSLEANISPVEFTPPGASAPLTNLLQRFFFLQNIVQNTNEWNGVGFRVLNSTVHTNRLDQTGNVLVGALYRFSMKRPDFFANEILDEFEENPLPMALSTNVNGPFMRRLVDGVVHFKVTPYRSDGHRYWDDFESQNFKVYSTNDHVIGSFKTSFMNAALPASIDLEVGIIEPQALEQLRPLIADGNQAAIRNFLVNNAGKIHIFRRQIPIRTAVR